jgi:hypothetical protein
MAEPYEPEYGYFMGGTIHLSRVLEYFDRKCKIVVIL